VRVYDTPAYRQVRRGFKLIHLSGGAICVRCGKPIEPHEPMDIGHVDGDPTTIAGPEHRRCNRATSSHRRRRSRAW
jgi:hypothetical protein